MQGCGTFHLEPAFSQDRGEGGLPWSLVRFLGGF